jgi:ribosomal protein S18 acetylase RimI-like enzyme
MIEISDISKDKIYRLRNLWEKLNKLHYEDSIYFEDFYESFTFDKRIEALMKIGDENLKISVIGEGQRFLGYCISSVDGENGEIVSIYVDEELRDRGFGKELMNRHVAWLKEMGCANIRAAVSFGHDSVIDFYHRMGFYERIVYFELRD